MNKPVSTLGTLLSFGESDSDELTALYSIVSSPDKGGEPEDIDTTVLYGEYMTHMPGKKDIGAMEYTGNCGLYGPPDAESDELVDEFALLAGLDSKTLYYWKEEYEDGSACSWYGYPNVRLNGDEVNAVHQYTLSIMFGGDFQYIEPEAEEDAGAATGGNSGGGTAGGGT